MSRPQCEQCEIKHEDPKKRRNVKLLTEGIQEHLRTVEIEINEKEKLQILKNFSRKYGTSRCSKNTSTDSKIA